MKIEYKQTRLDPFFVTETINLLNLIKLNKLNYKPLKLNFNINPGKYDKKRQTFTYVSSADLSVFFKIFRLAINDTEIF